MDLRPSAKGATSPIMTDKTVRTRFAPSPTGYLHVGGARTALFNWLYARHHGGQFVLRIEDTDRNRNIEDGIEAILRGLEWLGLTWDEGPGAGGDRGPYYQSQRQGLYDKHLATLEQKGLVYTEDNGAVRFRSPRQPVVVDDKICGRVEFTRDEPDMTIRRPDGSYIFHFVNVVDDLEMGMTHVIRGEDHLSNTPKHIELFEALDASPPVYAHIPLILNADGSKMSKRDQGASVTEYREQAYLPQAVVNYLALLGWSPKDDQEQLPIEEIIARFDFPGINKSNASFDLKKLLWLNGQVLMGLDGEAFRQHATPVVQAAELDLDDDTLHRLLPLVQTKVSLASEIPGKIAFFQGDRCDHDPAALAKLKKDSQSIPRLQSLTEALSAASPWTEETIGQAIGKAAQELEEKKGKLMFPARIAASGQAGGPELLPMLSLLGQDRVLLRFRDAIQVLEK